MSEIDEHLERQINRALDGELTEDERLELDRELIRHPQARQMMERYAELDALAGESLGTLWVDQLEARTSLAEAAGRPGARGYRRAWWLLPGAVAAAILAALWIVAPPAQRGALSPPQDNTLVESTPSPGGARTPVTAPPQGPWRAADGINRGVVPVNHRPTWTDRAIDRGVYGVRGSDGNIYLIEVERTRTREQPGSRLWPRPVGGDL